MYASEVSPEDGRRSRALLVTGAATLAAVLSLAVGVRALDSNEPIACTLEGQVQSDGSVWGRNPNNNCEFAPPEIIGGS